MTDKYKDLRDALAAGPTPGPWKPACKANGATSRHPAIIDDNGQVGNVSWRGSERQTNANASYISSCHPETIRALLAERDALREELQAMVDDDADEDLYYWMDCL